MFEKVTQIEKMERNRVSDEPFISMGKWYCMYCGKETLFYGQPIAQRMWCWECHRIRR